MTRPFLVLLLLPLLWLLWLPSIGCGGGGGSGDPSRSGTTRGAIAATGSAIVAGTTWDTIGAEVVRDGVVVVPAPGMDAFFPGETATLEGVREGDTGVASRVVVDAAIRGPVRQVDVVDRDFDGDDVAKELTLIFDQPVRVHRELTLFSGSVEFEGMAGIAVDDLVEVFGYRDGEGAIRATLVHGLGTAADPVAAALEGNVSSLVAGTSFAIDGITVLFDATTTDLSGVPDGILFEDDFVEVVGLWVSGLPDQVDARGPDARIELDPPATAGSQDDFEIVGIVSDFVNVLSFSVGGQPVNAGGLDIDFDPPLVPPSWLRDGVRVEVDGQLVDGTLFPDEVMRRQPDVRIQAALESVDAAAGTLSLLGIEVMVEAGTRFVDCEPDPLAGMTVGEFLGIRGAELQESVIAEQVVCAAPAGAVELQALLDEFDNPGAGAGGCDDDENDCWFEILGVRIDTNADTDYDDFAATVPPVVDEDGFYAFLSSNPLAVLNVRDADPDPDVFLAGEVELVGGEEED